MADACEEAALLGESAAIRHDGIGIHLEAIVVMEAERFMTDDSPVQLESGSLKSLPRSGMAAVEDRHVVLLGHGVDGIEKRKEVLFRIYVLLPVGGKKDILSLLKAESLMDIGSLYLGEVLMENFSHRGSGHIGPFLGKTALREISSCVFAVGEVHIGDDVNNPTVGFLGKAFVLAAVSCLHMEYGDMESLRSDHREAAVGVTENEDRVGLDAYHKFVALGYDVAHRLSEVGPYSVHVHFRILQLEVTEEHSVEVVIVVLSRMCQDRIEILPALVDHSREADDFGTGAYYYEEFQFAVVGERYVGVICHRMSLSLS